MNKQIIKTDNAPSPIGPYNQAVRTGKMLFMSGQIALDPKTGQLVTDNIEAETKLVMENMKGVLEAAGMDFSNIAKCTIFISDMNNFSRINEVYGQYFDNDTAPARECVEVRRLPKDVNVEISCTAVAD